MSIIKAIDRAYQTMREREWDRIYWAIDLHGVCLKSNYEQGGYEWINEEALQGLKAIVSRPESRIILWSSCYEEEYSSIINFFMINGINVYAFNTNAEVSNTDSGCFDNKFYFSILIDDKAGFDPDVDWTLVREFLATYKD